MNKIVQESDPVLQGVLSFCLSDNAHIFAALAYKCFTEVNIPVPVVHIGKQEQRKGSISPQISQEQSCDLSRAKTIILS